MIFQIVASVVLLLIVVYAYTQLRLAPTVSLAVISIASVGQYFVVLPDHAIAVARAFGIGRGTDLIFYLWILLSLVVTLNLYLKLRLTNELFAELVRQMALRDAKTPESEPPAT